MRGMRTGPEFGHWPEDKVEATTEMAALVEAVEPQMPQVAVVDTRVVVADKTVPQVPEAAAHSTVEPTNKIQADSIPETD